MDIPSVASQSRCRALESTAFASTLSVSRDSRRDLALFRAKVVSEFSYQAQHLGNPPSRQLALQLPMQICILTQVVQIGILLRSRKSS